MNTNFLIDLVVLQRAGIKLDEDVSFFDASAFAYKGDDGGPAFDLVFYNVLVAGLDRAGFDDADSQRPSFDGKGRRVLPHCFAAPEYDKPDNSRTDQYGNHKSAEQSFSV